MLRQIIDIYRTILTKTLQIKSYNINKYLSTQTNTKIDNIYRFMKNKKSYPNNSTSNL